MGSKGVKPLTHGILKRLVTPECICLVWAGKDRGGVQVEAMFCAPLRGFVLVHGRSLLNGMKHTDPVTHVEDGTAFMWPPGCGFALGGALETKAHCEEP